MQPTLEDLISLASQAGEILTSGFGKIHTIRHKGRIDLVTEMDHRSEDMLIREIQARFPGHSLVTEESGNLTGSADHCWFIDPLDGTLNYAHAVPIYCVSIAYAEKGHMRLAVVLDPTRPECFTAERGKGAWLNGQPIHVSAIRELVDALLVTGFPYYADAQQNNLENFSRFFYEVQAVRRFGSAALDLCYVAAGRADGYWQLESKPWDIAAGTLIVEEAGGLVTNLKGERDYLTPPYGTVAANARLNHKMRTILNRNESLITH